MQHSNDITPNQQRFFELANQAGLLHFWDTERLELCLDIVADAQDKMHISDMQLLHFLANVWLGWDKFDFDMVHAIKCMDDFQIDVIKQWVSNPFFP